ncbi:MAG: hypothetical protein H7Y60_02265 [Rhodospirillaceae bacterium]|nr:hypothetical protein [Rhodospirillales bacterium]
MTIHQRGCAVAAGRRAAERARDYAMAEAMLAVARHNGDDSWTPYRAEGDVWAVAVKSRGGEWEMRGPSLKDLALLKTPGAADRRSAIDAFQAFCQEFGISGVYHAGFHLPGGPVPVEQARKAHLRLSAAVADAAEYLRAHGAEAHLRVIEAAPHEGGRRIGPHAHLIYSGPPTIRVDFEKYLGRKFEGAWVGKRPRAPKALNIYLSKRRAALSDWRAEDGADIDKEEFDRWDPEHALEFCKQTHGLNRVTHFGRLREYRRTHRHERPERAEDDRWMWRPRSPRPKRTAGAVRAGETIIKPVVDIVGGEQQVVLLVRNFRGNYTALAQAYDLTEVEAWAERYWQSSQGSRTRLTPKEIVNAPRWGTRTHPCTASS